MPRMETNIEPLTRRYERIITGLLAAIGAANRVFPLWLTPLLDRLVLKGHCRALNLLGKLAAGLYRQPRPRTTPRPSQATRESTPARSRAPRLPTLWKWLTRALPSPICEAARAYGAELQQFLSEPAMVDLFAAAPALRTHLRPFCRALGVTLPAEAAPPDAHGPEPEPPPAIPLPIPVPGWTIQGREITPAQSRDIDMGIRTWRHDSYYDIPLIIRRF